MSHCCSAVIKIPSNKSPRLFPCTFSFLSSSRTEKKKKKEDNLDYAPSSTEITTTTPLLVTSSAGNNAFLIHKNRCKMQHEYP